MGDDEKDWSDGFLQVRISEAKENATRAQARLAFLEKEQARREEEAKRPLGQRIAVDIIRPVGGYHIDVSSPKPMECFRFAIADPALRDGAVAALREAIADAVETVRLNTIELCAKAVDQRTFGGPNSQTSHAVRNLK